MSKFKLRFVCGLVALLLHGLGSGAADAAWRTVVTYSQAGWDDPEPNDSNQDEAFATSGEAFASTFSAAGSALAFTSGAANAGTLRAFCGGVANGTQDGGGTTEVSTQDETQFYTPEAAIGEIVTIQFQVELSGSVSASAIVDELDFLHSHSSAVVSLEMFRDGELVFDQSGSRFILQDGSLYDFPFISGVFDYSLTGVNGSVMSVEFKGYASAFGASRGDDGTARAKAEFANTLRWMGITSVTDSQGNPVTDYTFVDEFGNDWTQPMPELTSVVCGNRDDECVDNSPCGDGDSCNGAEVCNLPATANCYNEATDTYWSDLISQAACLAMPGYVWQGVGTCGCGTPLECPNADNDLCTVETCDPIDGCQITSTIGLDCDTPPGPCFAAGDGCDPDTGGCVYPPLPEGEPCTLDPADPACSNYTCDEDGECVNRCAGTCDDEDPCTTDSGTPPDCVNEPIVCPDDGLACTDNECHISNGVPEGYVCVHDLLPGYCLIDGICYADGDRHPTQPCRGCSSVNNTYNWTLFPTGAPCQAAVGGECLINGRCTVSGGCGLEPHHELCDDHNACTSDLCVPIGCTNEPILCVDGIECTMDACEEGPADELAEFEACCCLPKELPPAGCFVFDFDGDGDVDEIDRWIFMTSHFQCVHTPDHDFCDMGQFCLVATCDPASGCTAVSACPPMAPLGCLQRNVDCDEDKDMCVDFADDSQCINDGDPCDGVQTCDPDTGQCVGGTPISCNDDNDCTSDHCEYCDPDDDGCTPDGYICVHTPDHAACNDNIPCTIDSCNSSSGCLNAPNHSVCSDGLYCNGAEKCVRGVGCRPGPRPCVGICNEASDTCRGGSSTFRGNSPSPDAKQP